MPWAKISFEGADAERRYPDFEVAFRHLFLKSDDWPDRDAAALYRSPGLAFVLSPVAADWMGRAVPPYKLERCDRPAADAVRLVTGDTLCGDPAYADLSHAGRTLIREERRLDDEAAMAQAYEWAVRCGFTSPVPDVPVNGRGQSPAD